jgi:hypothetical protein
MIDTMNLFSDSDETDLMNIIESTNEIKLTKEFKDLLRKYGAPLAANKRIAETHDCICLDCGDEHTGIYFIENDTSNAVCLNCITDDYVINLDNCSIVYNRSKLKSKHNALD